MVEIDFLQGGVCSRKKCAERSIPAGSGTPPTQATIHFVSMTMTQWHTISYGSSRPIPLAPSPHFYGIDHGGKRQLHPLYTSTCRSVLRVHRLHPPYLIPGVPHFLHPRQECACLPTVIGGRHTTHKFLCVSAAKRRGVPLQGPRPLDCRA
jgi:hypothetical protein